MTDKTAEQTALRMALLANGCAPLANGTTAPEATKRGYGLWRGEVLHPADPRMDEIVASGYPITDTKGLGLRYVSVRGPKVIPHFRVRDPEKFSAALDRMFPAVHDAVVRLVAEDIQAGGYDALASWCVGTVLPERFEVAGVVCEMRCCEDGVTYRPDISVLHTEGGRIELEVVNTHAPERARLDAAWGAGHLVLTLRIRDLVEDIVFSEGRGAVPDDVALRGMLRGRRFGLCGREHVPEDVQVVWRDLNLSAYAMELRENLRAAYREDVDYVQNIVADICCGCTGSDIAFHLNTSRDFRGLHNLFDRLMCASFSGGVEVVFPPRRRDPRDSKHQWSIAARDFRELLAVTSAPHESLGESAGAADDFLDSFDNVVSEPAGVKRLRYSVAAVWHCRLRRLSESAELANSLIGFGGPNNGKHRRLPLAATEQGIA